MLPEPEVPVWLGVVVVLWLGVVVVLWLGVVVVVCEGVVPTVPDVPMLPVVDGEVWVADGEVWVPEGVPMVPAPPGAVVDVVWAVATPIATANANRASKLLCMKSLLDRSDTACSRTVNFFFSGMPPLASTDGK